jgi:transcriptional regulator with XRE-family HTH domain
MVKIIGTRVREIRNFKRLTGKQLAGLAAISQAELTNIEKGKRSPGFDIIERLAGALEVTLDYLAGKEDADALIPEALARQSLRIFRRRANLTREQELFVERVVETESAPQTIEGWSHLVKNVGLWTGVRS